MMMTRHISILVVIALMTLMPVRAVAQWSFDVVSVEAYIADHKTQRSLLLARSTLEQSNKVLHNYSMDAAADYKHINVELDKYTRAFDVIDVLYQSLRTVLNVRDTYNTVSDRVGDYTDLLSQYNEKVVKRGRINLADTIIITISKRAVDNIYQECKYLYSSITDLTLYATGSAACSTADLLTVIENINTSLDNIEKHLNSSYFDTWRYMQVRMGYWKESVYVSKTRREIANAAYRRWRIAGNIK